MIIVQLSDIHLTRPGERTFDGTHDSEASTRAAIAHINNLSPQPDLILITGDIVHNGTPEEYAFASQLLSGLRAPFFVVPGNHDDRTLMAMTFSPMGALPPNHHEDSEFLQYTIEDHPVRMIALDTSIPGEPRGNLCPRRTAWLADRLAEDPDRPTLIFMHHPPMRTGIRIMDNWRCFGTEGLSDLLSLYTNVELILCGHLHRFATSVWNRHPVVIAPSSGVCVAMDLDKRDHLRLIQEPPAILVHLWEPEIGFVTHVSPIGDFPIKALEPVL
ncbi:MAG: hypothetical protein A2018_02915 [Alphaproteobacteria bacterium GWF2_58_20]|nr:MAG: hypothetical protein A2018_02915 [Alphaproteobacteria bacterium GWF2_58_20]